MKDLLPMLWIVLSGQLSYKKSWELIRSKTTNKIINKTINMITNKKPALICITYCECILKQGFFYAVYIICFV